VRTAKSLAIAPVRGAAERYNLIEDLLVRHLRDGRGAAPALHYEGRTITYGELAIRVGIARRLLQEKGIGRGDRVALILQDCPAYVYVLLAAISLGAVPLGLDRNQNPTDVPDKLRHVGARVVALGDGEHAHTEAMAASGFAVPVIRLDPLLTGVDAVEGDDTAVNAYEICTAGDVLYVTFSSGTTGTPKAVVRRHGDILHCARSVATGLFSVGPNDVVLPVTKLPFGYSLVGGLMFTLLAGGALILCPDAMTAGRIVELARCHRPTVLLAQPRVLAELCSLIEGQGKAWATSLKTVVSAGDVLSTAVRARWTRLSGLTVADGFGSVEVGHIFLGDDGAEKPEGAIGRALPGYTLRLIDGDGDEVPEGATGRLCIAGQSLTSGYWNDPVRTREAFVDGWHISDDLFVRSGDTYYYAGRWDDLIKTGCGEWISPVRIESVLRRDPRVADCAVTAVRNEAGVTRVGAFVVATMGTDIDALVRELPDLVQQEWPRLEHMRVHEVRLRSVIPRSANGKILRSALT
jgi:acyl-coenzyme A synthetase/AMP-(fatty) acid ligase